ncbi:MAG: molybdopterin-dependent oxidoreductase [candidate division Zixibacteria bacterium]|nr:molybdopterin-dependent oxidoreductase [candidate division Zixibacteria bacterium]
MMKKYTVINTPVHNIDGIAKITGRAEYAFDIKLPRMLYGKILRSSYPHAKILRINTKKAEKLSGVKAVVTGKDTLGVKQGIWRRFKELCDEEILARSKVRYIGEPVAAVAAVDEDTTEEALDLIEVEYEPLPGVFEPLEAIKEGAPQLHEHAERNINVTRHIEWGDVDEGFKEADHIREDWFRCSSQHHVCMETHNAVASYSPDKKLTVWTSTQSHYYIQVLLSWMLGLRENDIRVISRYTGGGFGSKFELDSAQFCSSLLSMKLFRPVKITLTREEEFMATKRRTPMFYYLRTGVKKDGTFVAKEGRVFTEGGAYTSMGATALYLTGFFQAFPYVWPSYRYDGYRVYTNTAPTSAMRGFGAPQATFCAETQIDLIANDLGIDPVEIRRKNAMYPGYEVPGQATIQSCGLSQCLDKIEDWIQSRGKLPPNRGIGIAAYGFMSGGIFNWFDTPYAFSSAVIQINIDGKVDLYVGSQDMGQGSNTTMAMICAEELGVRVEDIRLHMGDTENCPVDLGAWGSRETLMQGNAVKMAAAEAKRQIIEVAAAKLSPNIVYDLDIKDQWIHLIARPERGLSYFDVVKEAIRGKNGQPIIARGHYTPHRKGMISPAYSFGVQAVEAEVDPDTGKITLQNCVTAHDCGQVINPLGVEGQLEGAMAMAAGYGFTEDLPMDEGKILNPNLVDYKVLRATEMPETKVIEVETFEPEGPFGAKEAGEGLTNPTAGALGNAIFHATGLSVKNLPITPEKVLEAFREKKKKKRK